MKQYLDFFYPETAGSLVRPLQRAFAAGARTALLVGTLPPDSEVVAAVEGCGFAWTGQQLFEFRSADCADVDLILVVDGSGSDVSMALHACIGAAVAVIAPVTAHHFSRRTLYLMSIPKAGTHMLIRLLGLMGLDRSPDRAPLPGTWCTPVGYEYHAPCRELLADDWFYPVGKQLLFRSPAIFVYRHPLDIVVSERDWFVKPEHAFSGYLNCFGRAEQLERLIADQSVMGNIRDRINRYSGWMHFENVIPVSYEELVGEAGGGSDSEQQASIWSLQLKLHIPGSPEKFGASLYDRNSATFSKGRIGRHADSFSTRHYELLGSLPQDFMQALGYSVESKFSSRVEELRRRPIRVKEIADETFYTARLIREGILGYNVVEIAGKFYPVRQGEPITSSVEAQAVVDRMDGFMTLADALDAINSSDGFVGANDDGVDGGTELVVEGYFGFNVVRHEGQWFGFDQATGPIDIGSLDDIALEQMRENRVCVTGNSCADIKAEILRINF